MADPIAQELGRRGWETYTATCRQCGQQFEAKRRVNGGGRSGPRYCPGPNCRQKAWRERKKL